MHMLGRRPIDCTRLSIALPFHSIQPLKHRFISCIYLIVQPHAQHDGREHEPRHAVHQVPTFPIPTQQRPHHPHAAEEQQGGEEHEAVAGGEVVAVGLPATQHHTKTWTQGSEGSAVCAPVLPPFG